jgi:hypothetical protein
MTPVKKQAAAHVHEGNLHLLEDHLREVGHLASRFAGTFGSEAWGRLAGSGTTAGNIGRLSSA